MRIRQVAERLNIGYHAALALVNTAAIPHVQIAGRRSKLVDPADVDAFIEAQKVGTKLAPEARPNPTKLAQFGRAKKSNGEYERGWYQQVRRK